MFLQRVLLLILFLSFVIGCVPPTEQELFEETEIETSLPTEKNSPLKSIVKEQMSAKTMTFEVTIPHNTLKGDTIWIYVRQLPYKMSKIKDQIYTISLNETQLFEEGYIPQSNDKVRYRYARNGWDFHTAEYLAPTPQEPDRDTNNYFWTNHGREVMYQPGNIQKDSISRWRWFPEQGLPARTTSLVPDQDFLPRINALTFRSGQTIEDLYVPAFHEFFNTTAKHIKQQGYTWVELDPPWQWEEVNGLPHIKNDFHNNPNYPNDETFLEEVRAYKREGLQVLIAPQICCTFLNTTEKSKEWWDRYFDETERFLLHFAQLAEKGNADAFMYAVSSWDIHNQEVDVEKEWRAIFGNIKTVFRGEVGQMIWVLGPEVSPSPHPIPDTSYVKWGDQLDFVMVATEFPLSTNDNPTPEQLRIGAAQVLDGVKVFYDTFHKPIIIRNAYFNVKYSWKGQTFYQINSIPWIGDSEADLRKSKYEFNTEDHTRTVNAMFQAIAQRPWVVGYFHFGYTHWEDPLSAGMSVRGKPAEDIWRKWNERIYNNTS